MQVFLSVLMLAMADFHAEISRGFMLMLLGMFLSLI